MSQLPSPPRIKAPNPQRITHPMSFGGRSNLIASWTIGNSGVGNEVRNTDQGLPAIKWDGFVGTQVPIAIDNGFERFAMHNNFGTIKGQEMMASQYLAAKAANLHWLTDKFAEAWKPITARYEVIAYQGSIKQDPSFEAEWRAGTKSFSRYAISCYQPVIDAGMSVAFDAHQHLTPGHWAIAGARFVEQEAKRKNPKARMYFECGPAEDDWHWFKPGHNIWIPNDNSTIVHDRREPWQLTPVPESTETVLQLSMAPDDIINSRDENGKNKYNPPQAYIDLWAGCTWDNYPTWIKRFCNYHFERGRTVAVNPRDFAKFGLRTTDITGAIL